MILTRCDCQTYKIFSTFVDDLFAWIINAPTIHRLATLRDDVVFFVYLYQRWAYPVDQTRINEFGFKGSADGATAAAGGDVTSGGADGGAVVATKEGKQKTE